MVARKEHLTVEGLHKVLSIRASINNGLSERFKTSFPNVSPVVIPLVEQQKSRQTLIDYLASLREINRRGVLD